MSRKCSQILVGLINLFMIALFASMAIFGGTALISNMIVFIVATVIYNIVMFFSVDFLWRGDNSFIIRFLKKVIG